MCKRLLGPAPILIRDMSILGVISTAKAVYVIVLLNCYVTSVLCPESWAWVWTFVAACRTTLWPDSLLTWMKTSLWWVMPIATVAFCLQYLAVWQQICHNRRKGVKPGTSEVNTWLVFTVSAASCVWGFMIGDPYLVITRSLGLVFFGIQLIQYSKPAIGALTMAVIFIVVVGMDYLTSTLATDMVDAGLKPWFVELAYWLLIASATVGMMQQRVKLLAMPEAVQALNPWIGIYVLIGYSSGYVYATAAGIIHLEVMYFVAFWTRLHIFLLHRRLFMRSNPGARMSDFLRVAS